MKKIGSLVLLILCGVFFMTCALGSSSNSSTSRDSGGTTGSTSELATYRLNEDIYITNNQGKYRVKFTNIEETTDRNQFADQQADRVVIITWEYENLSIDEDLLVSNVLNFKLYDKDNNKMDTYSVSTQYGGTIGKGRKTVSAEAYALNSQDNYIELEFYDNIFNGKPDCKVIFEW